MPDRLCFDCGEPGATVEHRFYLSTTTDVPVWTHGGKEFCVIAALRARLAEQDKIIVSGCEMIADLKERLAAAREREALDTLRLDWLEQEANGISLIHDDGEHWGVSTTGFQLVAPETHTKPFVVEACVMPEEWRKTVREAIDAARRALAAAGGEGESK